MSEIPRRIRLDMMTPEELAIYNLVGEIEKLGAHPLLTDVVVLLGQARDKLADWVDLQTLERLAEIRSNPEELAQYQTDEWIKREADASHKLSLDE